MAITPEDRKPKKAKIKKASGEVTSVAGWKKSRLEDDTLELPSGNVCRLKRPGLPQLMAEGILPDMLTGIAQEAIEAGRSEKKLDIEDTNEMFKGMMSDPKGIEQMFDAVNRITAHCVLEPKVLYHRRLTGHQLDIAQGLGTWEDIPEDMRDSEVLYTDEVDDEDKFFIFQFVVGGSRDLESFRKEAGESLASLGAI